MSAMTIYGSVDEDGGFSILARVTSLSGSGTAVRPIEGNPIKQADVSSITCKVYALGTDKNNDAGTEVTPAPTVTVATSVYDTLQTSGWDTYHDPDGYNFRFDVSPTYTANPGEWYLYEFKFTLTDSSVIWLKAKVKTSSKTAQS